MEGEEGDTVAESNKNTRQRRSDEKQIIEERETEQRYHRALLLGNWLAPLWSFCSPIFFFLNI